LGRKGVIWDREGEEGTRVIQRKGKGREGREEGKGREGKGREGRGGRKEEEDMTWPPPKKFLDPPLQTNCGLLIDSITFQHGSDIRLGLEAPA
jgi:hypothetical protein